MSFPTSTLHAINEAMVAAYSGVEVVGVKNKLKADHKPDDVDKVADDRLPYLLFDIGNMTFQPWKGWERYVTWDVTATLKVKGEPGDTDKVLLRTLDALLERSTQVQGLPVDEEGTVTLYSDKTASLFDQGKLKFLAERGAPYITRVQVLPAVGAYGKAIIGFHVEAILELDRRVLPIARKAVLGIDPVPPGQIIQDLTNPQYVGVDISRDIAWGAYDTNDPLGQDSTNGPTKYVAGVDPSQLIQRVNVTPYSVALSVGTPTAQLSAVAIAANQSSQYVTSSGTWTSSDAAKATVSNTGLVTRVAAGSCTVSCTYNGVASNAVAVTVS